MMIVMERLTDKPDWHIKVFDDTITDKWIEEGLAIPVRPLYNEIVRDGKPFRPSDDPAGSPTVASRDRFFVKGLDTILDRGCLEYVSPIIVASDLLQY